MVFYILKPHIFLYHDYLAIKDSISSIISQNKFFMVGFAVAVTGAPGAGKSTLSYGLFQWFTAIKRECAVINLDPGAEVFPYKEACDVDIRDLITVEGLLEDLGPNGALVYAMEYLLKNIDWLKEQCDPLIEQGKFLIFDCPGQIELYAHHSVMKDLFAIMSKDWQVHCCSVQMVDSHHIADASKYIAVLLVCLSSMINLEMPMIHVLSKIDLVEQFGKLGKKGILTGLFDYFLYRFSIGLLCRCHGFRIFIEPSASRSFFRTHAKS